MAKTHKPCNMSVRKMCKNIASVVYIIAKMFTGHKEQTQKWNFAEFSYFFPDIFLNFSQNQFFGWVNPIKSERIFQGFYP